MSQSLGQRNGTYIGNLLPFPFDRIAQILFDHSHRGNGVGAECLNNLQRSHQAVLVDFLQHEPKLITSFFEDLWAGGKVRQSCRVKLRLFWSILSQRFDCTGSIVRRSIRSKYIEAKPLLLSDEDCAIAKIGQMR